MVTDAFVKTTHACEIRAENLRARFDPAAGGRLARLQWRRRSGEWFDVLVPMTSGLDGLRWPKAGAYPLVPYSNRIAHARLSFQGRTHTLTPHPDALPHTLHGHAQLLPWHCNAADGAAELRLACAAGPTWPWAFEASQRYTATHDALRLELSVRNVDRTPMPAGLGWHPFFTLGAGASLRHGARREWPHDAAYLPVGHSQPVGAEWQSPIALGAPGRTAYLGTWPHEFELHHDHGVRIRVSAEPVFDHLVVHRPADQPYVCIEPTTHVADGFNLAAAGVADAGLHILEPGDTLRGTIVVALSESTQSSA